MTDAAQKITAAELKKAHIPPPSQDLFEAMVNAVNAARVDELAGQYAAGNTEASSINVEMETVARIMYAVIAQAGGAKARPISALKGGLES